MILSLDIYRHTKLSGKAVWVNIEDEPDECDKPWHRFKHIGWTENGGLICEQCKLDVAMVIMPEIKLPRYWGI